MLFRSLRLYIMRAKFIGIGLICVISVAVVAALVFVKPLDLKPQKPESQFKDWNMVGPFAVDKYEYKIGESVFFIAETLDPNDSGNAVFVLPNGTKSYLSLPFDGENKNSFNYYFKPSVSAAKKICSTSELVGEWTVVFQGTQYSPIKFRLINETLPTEKGNFERVC